MNPIKLSEQLERTFIDYLTTTFDVNRDGKEEALAQAIQRGLTNRKALFNGPFLELTPPYQTGATLQALTQQGILDPKLLQMDCFLQNKPLPSDAPLYTHQETAIRRLCADNRNVVISSGTGSGKTECFLIPILNDLLIDPSPGVRAVLIYPMNALVNDQLDRLRVLLKGTDITFGRYTSELQSKAETARRAMENEWKEMSSEERNFWDEYPLPNEVIGRDQIREQGFLPQILITNYAMLEYLLLRPDDAPLFAKGQWKFIVLDEAHTYAGSQGIEVGLLMRRLKHRLRKEKGEVRCIATSATLTDDDAAQAQEFAEALFGEDFVPTDIIFGETDEDYVPVHTQPVQLPASVYLHRKEFDKLLHEIRQEGGMSTDDIALLMENIGLITEDALSYADGKTPGAFLWEVLYGNEDITRLRQHMADNGDPLAVKDVAEWLFGDRLEEEGQRQEALYHLIELAAMARPDKDKSSLLPARYHLFARPPQGMWVCLNPQCDYKQHQTDSKWSRLFANPREKCDCGAAVYPLVVCRSCGQPYVRMEKNEFNEFVVQADEFYKAQELSKRNSQKDITHYFTWHPIEKNLSLAGDGDEIDDEDELVNRDASGMAQTEKTLCLRCQQAVRNGRCDCREATPIHVNLHLVVKQEKKKRATRDTTVEEMNECYRCHSRAFRDTEIVTPIQMVSTTPLSVMTNDLYHQLPASIKESVRHRPGAGRKLLSFYDSRQGAARFAAFLQDVVNQDTYRRLIPKAAAEIEDKYGYADFGSLAERCMELALKNRVFHNDPDINNNNLPRDANYLEQHQRENLQTPIRTRLLAEITTGKRSRQSLETLGVLAVNYFSPNHSPNFVSLAEKIGLSAIQTQTLVAYLLDELRRAKVVTLPKKVSRDDKIFGRNKFSPTVVQRNPEPHQVAWIGKTNRQRRRRLVQKVLRFCGKPYEDESVITILEHIWEWLIHGDTDIMDISRPASGFQIRHERLFFLTKFDLYRCDDCLRFSPHGNALCCPHPHCEGTLRLMDNKRESPNFYRQRFGQHVVPMRVEEHTAQLSPEKGRKYQNDFKEGKINVLSCSTTFEMGIDLGDLQAVVMSNIPPTVANYKQRAGRAGRRTSGTAFILAWASERPHDQTYFKLPEQIISGRVRVPHVEIDNPVIIRRHVNAILLSEFLRYQQIQTGRTDFTYISDFFDAQTPGEPHINFLSQWLESQEQRLQALLTLYAAMIAIPNVQVTDWLNNFSNDIHGENGKNHYDKISGYYIEAQERLAQQTVEFVQKRQSVSDILVEMERYEKLLKRFREKRLVDHLSDKGVLPSYSFPLYTVDLRVPKEENLRLQRDLRQAIREYAPGQEIVADKRIWKSGALDFFGKEPETHHYRICENCNHLEMNETPGKPMEDLAPKCRVCYEPFQNKHKKARQFIKPDGFRADWNQSGKPAGQYVNRPRNLMRSALLPSSNVDMQKNNELMATGYDRYGKLLYVNEGFLGRGFNICLKCGQALKKAGKCNKQFKGQPCTGEAPAGAVYTLGFDQRTDTLHLQFYRSPTVNTPASEDKAFWLSLKYALINGACHALQIERKDIDGVLFPTPLSEQDWQQTIVLYDNVPGGAGHVKRIQEEIREVIGAALEVVDCDCHPDTSCYRCLRDYQNQWEHHLLERGRVETFLKALYSSLSPTEGEVAGVYDVSAINLPIWLMEQVQGAEKTLTLFAEDVSLEMPTSATQSWLDVLYELLTKGVEVNLYLAKLPTPVKDEPESLAISYHLRTLLTKGLTLRETNKPTTWQIVIDPDGVVPRAIGVKGTGLSLVADSGISGLISTTHREAVQEILASMPTYGGHKVQMDDLRPPPDVKVIDVKANDDVSEQSLFSDIFEKPIESMFINDGYLVNEERILNRLGAYLELAEQGGQLQRVSVKTWAAGSVSGSQSTRDQQQAIAKLKQRFEKIPIRFGTHDQRRERGAVHHDRFIELKYTDGTKARILIGRGLDFIQPDGSVLPTYIIIENPYLGKS